MALGWTGSQSLSLTSLLWLMLLLSLWAPWRMRWLSVAWRSSQRLEFVCSGAGASEQASEEHASEEHAREEHAREEQAREHASEEHASEQARERPKHHRGVRANG